MGEKSCTNRSQTAVDKNKILGVPVTSVIYIVRNICTCPIIYNSVPLFLLFSQDRHSEIHVEQRMYVESDKKHK